MFLTIVISNSFIEIVKKNLIINFASLKKT